MSTTQTAIEELRQDFTDSSGPDEYYTSCLRGVAFEHITTVSLDEHRWYTIKLDVYRRRSDGRLAGVRWMSPATEEQEGQERCAEVVPVVEVVVVTYRVPATPGASALGADL